MPAFSNYPFSSSVEVIKSKFLLQIISLFLYRRIFREAFFVNLVLVSRVIALWSVIVHFVFAVLKVFGFLF